VTNVTNEVKKTATRAVLIMALVPAVVLGTATAAILGILKLFAVI